MRLPDFWASIPASSITLEAHERLYLQGYLLGLNSEEGRKLGGVPTLPTTAPLEPNKRLVLDGVLAGLFARVPGCQQAYRQERSCLFRRHP